MTWGNKNWGRDINRHHGWNIPPAIRDLPLDLKRTGLYPRQQGVIAAAAQQYIDDPQEQPIYAPQVLQFAAPNASPPVPVREYATSSWRARADGNEIADRLSQPAITINPIRWAAMKRGAQELPGIRSLNTANVGEALQRARPGSLPAGGRSPLGEMVDPRSLVAAAESERLQAANVAAQRQDARLRALQTADLAADGYGRVLNGLPKRYR